MNVPSRRFPWLLLAGLLSWPTGALAQKIDAAALTVTPTVETVNLAECATTVISVAVETTTIPYVNEHSAWILEAGDACADTDPTDPYVACNPGAESCC